MLKVFCSPARYVQGRDATRSLASELSRLDIAGKALIIASASARKALEPVWRETFPAAGLDYAVMDFGGECSLAEISRGVDEARRVSASTIVGAGGG
jgi:glycerol dehydrogenase